MKGENREKGRGQISEIIIEECLTRCGKEDMLP